MTSAVRIHEAVRAKKEMVLADAAMHGDEYASKKHNVGIRTIRRYRTQARREPGGTLASAALIKVAAVQRHWIEAGTAALLEITDRLSVMCRQCKPTPEGVHAVAGAVKILSEASNAHAFLADRLRPRGLDPTGSIVVKEDASR